MRFDAIRKALRRPLADPPPPARPLFDLSYDELIDGAVADLEVAYGKPVDQITEEDVRRKRSEARYVQCHDCGGTGCDYCDGLGQVRVP